MERTEHFSSDENGDETLVTPRFDREEAAEARPVVPLSVVSGEAQTFDAAHARAGLPNAWRRRSWPLALVLVSVLVGGVLGGAGLYFYQKHQQAEAAPAPSSETTEQSALPADAPPPPSPSTTLGETAVLPAPTREEVAAVEDKTGEPSTAEAGKDKNKDSDKKDDDSKKSEAAPRPGAADEDRGEAAKRGKKGERDAESEGRERRPRRVGEVPQTSRDEGEEAGDDREARRIDSIVYGRERRGERRRRRQPSVDRVRGIFEGQPQQK